MGSRERGTSEVRWVTLAELPQVRLKGGDQVRKFVREALSLPMTKQAVVDKGNKDVQASRVKEATAGEVKGEQEDTGGRFPCRRQGRYAAHPAPSGASGHEGSSSQDASPGRKVLSSRDRGAHLGATSSQGTAICQT